MPSVRTRSPLRAFIISAVIAVAYFVVTDGWLGPYFDRGPWHEVMHIIADWAFVGATILVWYHLFRHIAQQRERLASLWRIAIEADIDHDAQALAMLSEGARSMEMESGTIGHIEDEDYVFDVQERTPDAPRRLPAAESLAARAAISGRTVKSEDLNREPLLREQRKSPTPMRSFISTPFRVRERAYALTFRSRLPRPRPFSLEDVEYTELLANFFGRLMLQRDQELQIERLAFSDSLTGLANRASFREHLQRQIARSARHKTRFCLLYIDLDGFKQVNDRFGHSAGDAVLAVVGQRLLHAVRADDIVGRLGGDEFGLLAGTLTEPNEAAALAQRLRNTLSEPFVAHATQLLVNGSIGIAFYPDDGDSVETLIEHADLAAYRAKHSIAAGFSFCSPAVLAGLDSSQAQLAGGLETQG